MNAEIVNVLSYPAAKIVVYKLIKYLDETIKTTKSKQYLNEDYYCFIL